MHFVRYFANTFLLTYICDGYFLGISVLNIVSRFPYSSSLTNLVGFITTTTGIAHCAPNSFSNRSTYTNEKGEEKRKKKKEKRKFKPFSQYTVNMGEGEEGGRW